MGSPGRHGLVAVAFAAALAAVPVSSAAAIRAPRMDQLVVFKSGAAFQRKVRAKGTTVKVGRRRCAVGTGTPLAALVRSRPGRIGVKDYASCSRRPADAVSLYVRSIRGDRAGGPRGWVYKVGHRQGTSGAADTSGPFGRGRLRGGQRITWFFCTLRKGSCQRTLELRAKPAGSGVVSVRVRSYDDEGRGAAAAGATVSSSGVRAITDSAGRATLTVSPGRHTIHAEKPGLIRSFGELVTVR